MEPMNTLASTATPFNNNKFDIYAILYITISNISEASIVVVEKERERVRSEEGRQLSSAEPSSRKGRGEPGRPSALSTPMSSYSP